MKASDEGRGLATPLIAGPADAPIVVMANSLGSTLAMWDAQAEVLQRDFRVIRYDLRGHGGAPSPPGDYAIADLALDLLAMLDRLDIQRAHLVGLSIGAMIAMWIGAHAPDRVDRLVLCSASARLGPPERWATRAATVLREGTGSVARTVVGRWFTPDFASANPDLVERMVAMFTSADPVGYAGCCGAIERMDQTRDLPTIGAPTLVIAAADDLAIPPDHGARVAGAIPGGRLVIVPDAAHLVAVEQPDAVTRHLLDHLWLHSEARR